MITTAAILCGSRAKLLDFSAQESPVALQLGGDDPRQLAECARIAEDWGYSEVNLNVGCPSERVQSGRFGACLMAQPGRVAEGVAAMRRATVLPVTVKHRIGVEGLEHYEDLARFVCLVAQAGCDRFIVHARLAILHGLSPRENRTVPPLRSADVYRLKEDFPLLRIEINGGITTLAQACAHLQAVDGVMLGRAAYDNPYLFAAADKLFFHAAALPATRRQVLTAMIPYVEYWEARGVPPTQIVRHMLGLFAYQRVAKAWKRMFSAMPQRSRAVLTLLRDALHLIPDDILDARPESASLHDTSSTRQLSAL
jgi:tRNA-dihydrouridine synthase A